MLRINGNTITIPFFRVGVDAFDLLALWELLSS